MGASIKGLATSLEVAAATILLSHRLFASSQVQKPAQIHNPRWPGLDSGHENLADKERCEYADHSATSDIHKEVDAGVEAGDCPEGGQRINYSACRAIAEPDAGGSSEGYCGSVAGESRVMRKIENSLCGASCALSDNGVIDQEGARPRIRPRHLLFSRQARIFRWRQKHTLRLSGVRSLFKRSECPSHRTSMIRHIHKGMKKSLTRRCIT